jgi:hypothetical protein
MLSFKSLKATSAQSSKILQGDEKYLSFASKSWFKSINLTQSHRKSFSQLSRNR